MVQFSQDELLLLSSLGFVLKDGFYTLEMEFDYVSILKYAENEFKLEWYDYDSYGLQHKEYSKKDEQLSEFVSRTI
ncbi:gp57 [Sphingomonas phage PAU]|uniref:gp57 n=1 Tax=Sphingomonas phage PAU TaxID=1150991 RepID=UPI00025731C3|nr:gp57 [Sphingomonas phage PAU]AFF28055.1 gp57 [Sphingomonas phage PAU]